MHPPHWSNHFEIISDARNFVVGVVIEQRKDKKVPDIFYASNTLDGAPMNYTTIENDLLAIVFTINKFCHIG